MLWVTRADCTGKVDFPADGDDLHRPKGSHLPTGGSPTGRNLSKEPTRLCRMTPVTSKF